MQWKANKHGLDFFFPTGWPAKRNGVAKQERGCHGPICVIGLGSLQPIGNKPPVEEPINADNSPMTASETEAFTQAEILITDGEVRAPREKRNA